MDSHTVDLQVRWNASKEKIIKGKNGQYKIDRDRFLGRGGFGIVYVAFRRYIPQGFKEKQYEEVVLKQFKKSEKWVSRDDWDRELVLFEKLQKDFDPQYVLDVIDIFQFQADRKHYMVIKYASEGTLSDRIKTFMNEEKTLEFAKRSAQILKYLHYDLMSKYKSKEKGIADPNESLGIIHRDFKPANLVYTKNQMYLIDFGIAKLGYSELIKPYSNCGTNNYKAPEVSLTRQYNCKVDIYSFGCTLYEILSGGDKLLGSLGSSKTHNEKEQFVFDKLVDLEGRLVRQSKKQGTKNSDRKIRYPLKWIQILVNCLKVEPKKRWSSKQLLSYLQEFKNNDPNISDKQFYFDTISKTQRQLRYKKQCFELNFQIYRINACQDIIFTIFQHVYFNQPRLSKLVLYVVLKYAAVFLGERFARTKEKGKIFDRKDKIELLKRLVDQKKIEEIRKGSNEKIKFELNKEIQRKGDSQGKGALQTMMERYPELLRDGTVESRRVLYQFCFQNKKEIIENTRFAQLVGCMILMMEDIENYSQLIIEPREFEKNQVEALTLRKLFNFRKEKQEQIKQKGLQKLYNDCQCEQSVKSGINREQIRDDVPYEPK